MAGHPTARRRNAATRWNAILLTAAAFLATATPAHAAPLAGTCVVKVVVTYANATLADPSFNTSVGFSSTYGQCKGPNPTSSPLPTVETASVSLNGGGTAEVQGCELTVAVGSANVTFGGTVFADVIGGSFVFVGNVAGATITLTKMVGGVLVFAGVVDLVLDPLNAVPNALQIAECADEGMTSLAYVGTLTFAQNT